MPEETVREMNRIAEEMFGTTHDPEQIPITRESADKLDALTSHWLVYEHDVGGKPISWVVVVPTQRDLAERFLRGEVSERRLLDLTKPELMYDALYLCSAITVPEHRGRGLASKLLLAAVAQAPLAPGALVFAWPTTDEGRRLVARISPRVPGGVHLR